MADSLIFTKDLVTGAKKPVSSIDPMPVSGLISKGVALVADVAYNGFYVDIIGTTAWSATFVNGGTVSFTPIAGKSYPWAVTSVVPGTGGLAIGYLA